MFSYLRETVKTTGRARRQFAKCASAKRGKYFGESERNEKESRTFLVISHPCGDLSPRQSPYRSPQYGKETKDARTIWYRCCLEKIATNVVAETHWGPRLVAIQTLVRHQLENFFFSLHPRQWPCSENWDIIRVTLPIAALGDRLSYREMIVMRKFVR